jgi:hypothetical protein
LATDLESGTTGATEQNRYDRIKRLADLGKTDRASLGSARRSRYSRSGSSMASRTVSARFVSEFTPAELWSIAHKKKRSVCTESERLDPIVFLSASSGATSCTNSASFW